MSPLGVYIHWPYCTRICPYCDFNVRRARGQDEGALVEAIAADLAGHRAHMGERSAATVFLGGGTPSLLSAGAVARLIAATDAAFPLAADAEITLEANPEDWPRFAAFAAAGVNRLSIGVQALDDAALKALFRNHDAATALRAVEAAAAAGVRVSLDLIYARHGQRLAEWAGELEAALRLPVEHLSLYQLTIEPGTAFARAARRGLITTPDGDLAADFYELTQEICAAAGAPAYEISNHARGLGARSAHNLIYWTGGDWIGVGPGAHGRIPLAGARTATEAHARPEAYIAAALTQGVGWAQTETLDPRADALERLAMGLRVDEGVNPAALAAIYPPGLDPDGLAAIVAEGLARRTAERVMLTAKGRLVADHAIARLAPD